MQRQFWGTILLSSVIGAAHAVAQTAPPQAEGQAPPPAAPPQTPPPADVQQPAPAPPPTPPVAEMQPQPAAVAVAEPERLKRGFVEIFGNWGVNLGVTDYVPDGEPGTSKHPFANGFGGGATLGLTVYGGWLSWIVDYRYGHSSTRKGSIVGVLTEAQGRINFHEFTTGARMDRPLGLGTVYAQVGFGAVLPFHTTREIEYAPELAAIGISGTGTLVENFGVAVGVMAEFGFHYTLPAGLYAGLGVRFGTFQANNAGRETELTNFVTDFTAMPPVAVTTEIHHGTEAPVAPTTYSVQDVRLNLSVGYEF